MFIAGWKNLTGTRNYNSELIRLDKASHELKLFLASQKQSPNLSELKQISESLSSYRSRLASLPLHEQQAVSNYLASVDELVTASTQQAYTLRSQAVKAFQSSSKVFITHSSLIKRNAKKDFSLSQLQKYDQTLKAAARSTEWDNIADLRAHCFETMVDFISDPNSAAKPTSKRAASALPSHPDISASMVIPHYEFLYEGDAIKSFSASSTAENPHTPLILAIADQWQPNNPLPELPDIILKPIKQQPTDSPRSDSLRYMVIVNEALQKDVIAREAELLRIAGRSTFCTTMLITGNNRA